MRFARRDLLVLGVLALLAVGVAFADASRGGPSGDDGTVANQADGDFVGLSLDDASALAEGQGHLWRVGREDDRWLALTDDFVVGRVTFELDAGLVTVASIEQESTTSDGPGRPLTDEERASAAVLAAAMHRLLTVDHGFGNDVRAPFTGVHIAEQLGGTDGAPLEPLQREMIAAAVSQAGANPNYESDPEGLIAKLFDAPTQGVAVVAFDALRLEAERAEIELHLWCGSLCGVFLTYEAVLEDGAWVITGTIGPIAMS